MKLNRQKLNVINQILEDLDQLPPDDRSEVLEVIIDTFKDPTPADFVLDLNGTTAEKHDESKLPTVEDLMKAASEEIDLKGRKLAHKEYRKRLTAKPTVKVFGQRSLSKPQRGFLARNLRAYMEKEEDTCYTLALKARKKGFTLSHGTVRNVANAVYPSIRESTIQAISTVVGISADELLKKHA